MGKQNSTWLLGVLYINSEDERVLVPWKFGMAINFGHPQSMRILFWLWTAILAGLTLVPIIVHPSYFAASPVSLLWVLFSLLASLGLIRLNRIFRWTDYRYLPLAASGLVAAGVGFGIQGAINGPLVYLWGAGALGWGRHLLLGVVAAGAQTLGKIVGILLLLRARPGFEAGQCARAGLLVGLGFTTVEIATLYFSFAWRQMPVDSLLGVWERSSSSMFHIYSAGLLAVMIHSKRYLPVLPILAIHAFTDFLAGVHGALPLSMTSLQLIFSAGAMTVWIMFLVAGRKSRGGSGE